MHDANGMPLKVGDRVLIPAIVTSLHGHEDYCNVAVESEYGRRPDGQKENLGSINTGVLVSQEPAHRLAMRQGGKRPPLGSRARDRITGFVGTVTGHCQYISGCDQALLAPSVDEHGKPEEARWYDIQRLEVDESAPLVILDNSGSPGDDAPAPVR